MSDGVSLQVTGLKELARNLQEIPARLSTKIMREALHAAGDVMAAAAEASAKGEIAEDIIVKVHVSGDLGSNYVVVGPGYDRSTLKTRKRGKYAGRQDPSTSPGVFSLFVETGHGPPGSAAETRRAKRAGKTIEFGAGDTPPHPWLGPAFNSSKEEAVQVFATYVQAGLVAVAQELNK
jgi:HK97 gp10 family phage protein